MNNGKWKELLRDKKTRTNLLSALVLGIVLILSGNLFFPNKKNTGKENPEPVAATTSQEGETREQAEKVEKRLEEVLSQVEGAGKVTVMITMGMSSELEIAQDTKKEDSVTEETSQQGERKKTETNQLEKKAVLLEDREGGGVPVILKTREPLVQGVVIVAEGGGNVLVKDALSRAAQALLNLSADKVEILKMK